MAPHDEEDDPAVYRSGSSKNKGKEPQNSIATTSSASNQKKIFDDSMGLSCFLYMFYILFSYY
jgi:hypothetical protein